VEGYGNTEHDLSHELPQACGRGCLDLFNGGMAAWRWQLVLFLFVTGAEGCCVHA